MKQQFNKNKLNLINSKQIRVIRYRNTEDVIKAMREIVAQQRVETIAIVEHPHAMRISTIADHKGLWWVAEYIDLPGVCGTARTREEAVTQLQMNARIHIEVCLKMGLSVNQEFLKEDFLHDTQGI